MELIFLNAKKLSGEGKIEDVTLTARLKSAAKGGGKAAIVKTQPKQNK